MTITAQDILYTIATEPWSTYNYDDMVWGKEDARTVQRILNRALRYLINLEDFPFKVKDKTIETASGADSYTMVDGQINKIYDADTRKELEFIGNPSAYDKEKTDIPAGYWIEYNNPKSKIRLYPIPDNTYRYTVEYSHYLPVIDKDGKTRKAKFENAEDIINMPAYLEELFVDALVMRAIYTSNKDEQDENYRPTISEFNEQWALFKKTAKPKKVNVRIVL